MDLSNKKIGILTFHYTNNPGSVLQAYALQKLLQDLGTSPLIINYKRPCWFLFSALSSLRKSKKKYRTLKSECRKIRYFFSTKPKYEQFRAMHLNISKRISFIGLRLLQQEYSAFIAGSDQIWDISNAKVNNVYFLSFCKESKKKIAFSASLSRQNIKTVTKNNCYRLYLRNFAHISVREMDNATLLSSAFPDCDIRCTLDPTLLVPCQVWDALGIPAGTNGYVLIYLREQSNNLESSANRLAKEKNLPIIKIYQNTVTREDGTESYCGPQEWIGLMQNAGYVFTNSFHGLCFSLIFQTDFWIVLRRKKWAHTNGRLESLINLIHADDRIINQENKDLLDLKKPVAFDSISNVLSPYKTESLSYLKSVIN